MLYFSSSLFVENLDKLPDKLLDKKETTKEDRLKEIIFMILYGRQVDYSSFAFDEIKEICERLCNGYEDEIFASMKAPPILPWKLDNLPRRRDGCVFI